MSKLEQFILLDEFDYAGADRIIHLTVSSIGPTIARYGTEEQKRQWIPKIIRGELEFALGYSEPDAGSDLASLQSRAVLEGDQWVINGQKIWNTGAESATHEWLAVRTDPTSPKHKGISVIIVPMDTPGITISELRTWGDHRTNQIWFDNVRVPRENLMGEQNRGWYIIATALDFERVAIGRTGRLRMLFDRLVRYCKETVIDGQVLAQRADVRLRLAELAMDLEAARLLGLRTAWMTEVGLVPNVEASMSKVYTTELQHRLSDFAMQFSSLFGQLDRRDRWSPLQGMFEHEFRRMPFLRFGGGANEIMRNIIAQRGLGLPR